MKSDAITSATSATARSAGRAAAGLIRSIAGRGKRLLFPYRDYRVWHGSVLPAPELRFNGPDQQDDAFYLASSMREADRVISKLGCQPSSVLVDITSVSMSRIGPSTGASGTSRAATRPTSSSTSTW